MTLKWWWGEDSNLRSRKTSDLQSDPVGRLGTPPQGRRYDNTLEAIRQKKSRRRDSNPRQADYKSATLPSELRRLLKSNIGRQAKSASFKRMGMIRTESGSNRSRTLSARTFNNRANGRPSQDPSRGGRIPPFFGRGE